MKHFILVLMMAIALPIDSELIDKPDIKCPDGQHAECVQGGCTSTAVYCPVTIIYDKSGQMVGTKGGGCNTVHCDMDCKCVPDWEKK